MVTDNHQGKRQSLAKVRGRVAVLGCGQWGRNHVRNFAALGALAAVHDPDELLAAKIAAENGVPSASIKAILADDVIDGVVIAAPAEHHYELVRQALQAGKHVFVEKPLALQVAQAQDLHELSIGSGRILMVGHLLQYHPAFLRLRDIVSRGELGRLQYIYSNRLNLGRVRREESALWSFAPHDISMIIALAGELPDRVNCFGANYLHRHIADVTTTNLSFPGGCSAHIFVSWLHPFKEQKLVVVGEVGMAVFDDGQDWGGKLVIYPHRINWREGHPVPERAEGIPIFIEPAEPLRVECQHFLDCLDSGSPPRTDGLEGLQVLRVLDAAERSMLSGGPVVLGLAEPAARPYLIHETAVVDEPCEIGERVRIWHFSHILKNTRIGRDSVLGQNTSVGPDVVVGERCKIQNNVSIYKGVTLEDGVFCGPSCVFTNVLTPRAEIERKAEFLPTLVKRGATIGANATIICGVTIGEWSFVAAGAVVTRDVPAHALMAGVPARRVGWVSREGRKLTKDLICPETGRRHRLISEHVLVEME